MKWLKKYWWYIVISFSSSFVGGIICITITNKNIGSLADWVSGIGSLLAIAFAYWQIHIQTKEYEEDKKEKTSREILANRPFFSLIEPICLKEGRDHVWLTDEDIVQKNYENIFKKHSNDRDYIYFDSNIYAFEFKNVSQAVATNVVLKVEYQNIESDVVLRRDYCNIRTCLAGNEQAIMMPHSIIDGSNKYFALHKKISLFFTTIDDRAYCQSWIEKNDKLGDLCLEQVDIIEVPKEDVPNEGTSNFIII